MKRSFKLENLCCANCAAKIETSINKLDGVEASISFMTQRLNIEAEDMDSAVEQAQGIISKIEPDCVIVRSEYQNGLRQQTGSCKMPETPETGR